MAEGRWARAFFEDAMTQETDDCIVWPFSTTGGGYPKLTIDKRDVAAHRLVCERTYGPPPAGMHAAHGPCGNTRCINKRHLSWKTPKENVGDDRLRDGTRTYARGEINGHARLTERDVREIRQRWDTGESTRQQLATAFGVSLGHLNSILRGTFWKEAV